jgi:hypothetical protein
VDRPGDDRRGHCAMSWRRTSAPRR